MKAKDVKKLVNGNYPVRVFMSVAPGSDLIGGGYVVVQKASLIEALGHLPDLTEIEAHKNDEGLFVGGPRLKK